MRRVLFEWRGFRVWSYPALLSLGLMTGITFQNVAARAAGLPAVRVYAATFILLPIALAGTRVLFVMSHWPEYRRAPRRIWRRGEGGLSMYGGLPCMLIASVPVLALLRVPFWAFWDVSVFCIFPGMAFTRVGCLLNGCCSGRPTTGRFAVWLPDHKGTWARRIPVQLLEAATALAIAAGCAAARNWFPRPGMLFLAAAAAYASTRLVLEPLRDERERMWRIDLQTAISLTLIAGALAGLALLR